MKCEIIKRKLSKNLFVTGYYWILTKSKGYYCLAKIAKIHHLKLGLGLETWKTHKVEYVGVLAVYQKNKETFLTNDLKQVYKGLVWLLTCTQKTRVQGLSPFIGNVQRWALCSNFCANTKIFLKQLEVVHRT